MKTILKNILKKFGIQIKRYPDLDYRRRMKIINTYDIELLFDVGAYNGYYSQKMRDFGYKNKIISFEPREISFEELRQKSLRDANWIVNRYALGNEDTRSIINVSENAYSSSILNILPKHIEGSPRSKYVDKEEIEIKKLDSIFDLFCKNITRNIMLKIDTQGYEKNVLDGAVNSLNKISILQLEMSLVSLYENETLYKDMIEYIEQRGYVLYSLENGFSNQTTGQLLQIDGIFVRPLHAE
jgi:FkbM family methyltransferase